MDQTLTDFRANIEAALEATANQTEEVKSAAVAAAGQVPPPQGRAISALWLLLVGGLLIILVGSLAGIIYIQIDKPTSSVDTLVTIFTTTLAGLLGLFVKSPTT